MGITFVSVPKNHAARTYAVKTELMQTLSATNISVSHGRQAYKRDHDCAAREKEIQQILDVPGEECFRKGDQQRQMVITAKLNKVWRPSHLARAVSLRC